jgi:hypothetical protein
MFVVLIIRPLELLLALVPGLCRVKRYPHCGCKHGRGKILGIVACHLLGLAKRVVLRQVAIVILACRYSHSDRRGYKPVWLVCGVAGQNDKGYLAWAYHPDPLLSRDHLAARRDYA